jgi:hypothetical protein
MFIGPAAQNLQFFDIGRLIVKPVKDGRRRWLRDNPPYVHHTQFQYRVIRPIRDQPAPESFYLELTTRPSLLNPVAPLTRRIGQGTKHAKKVLPFSFAALGEKFDDGVVRCENVT